MKARVKTRSVCYTDPLGGVDPWLQITPPIWPKSSPL